MDELVVLKLGGGLITEKSELCTLKPDVINKLAKLISKLTGSGYRIILVHGAGSFGHLKAKKWHLHEGYIDGFKSYSMFRNTEILVFPLSKQPRSCFVSIFNNGPEQGDRRGGGCRVWSLTDFFFFFEGVGN